MVIASYICLTISTVLCMVFWLWSLVHCTDSAESGVRIALSALAAATGLIGLTLLFSVPETTVVCREKVLFNGQELLVCEKTEADCTLQILINGKLYRVCAPEAEKN